MYLLCPEVRLCDDGAIIDFDVLPDVSMIRHYAIGCDASSLPLRWFGRFPYRRAAKSCRLYSPGLGFYNAAVVDYCLCQTVSALAVITTIRRRLNKTFVGSQSIYRAYHCVAD